MRSLLAVVALAAALTGCSEFSGSTPTKTTTAPYGTVRGVLQASGGPRGFVSPLPGMIELTSATGKKYTVHVGNDGMLTVRVPAGSYTVIGASPKYDDNGYLCRSYPSPVHVLADRVTQVHPTCQER